MAAGYAHLEASDYRYCGDGRILDVDGAKNIGMTPILLDAQSKISFEMRTDGGRVEYLAVNSWNVLKDYVLKSFS